MILLELIRQKSSVKVQIYLSLVLIQRTVKLFYSWCVQNSKQKKREKFYEKMHRRCVAI